MKRFADPQLKYNFIYFILEVLKQLQLQIAKRKF